MLNRKHKRRPAKKFSIFLVLLVLFSFPFLNFGGELDAANDTKVGTQNLDIDIAPVAANVKAGDTGEFQLNFKVTGATANYKNAKIVVSLPANADFVQPLPELVISGVTPSYDAVARTLTWVFPTLASGQTYSTLIKVTPKNGTTANGTLVNTQVTFSADDFISVSDQASFAVDATLPISIEASFTGVPGQGTVTSPDPVTGIHNPLPGENAEWKIKVNIKKKDLAMLYATEGSVITITDSLPAKLTYVSSDTPATVNGSQVTWIFPVPTIAEQEATAVGSDVFSKEITLVTKVDDTAKKAEVITNSFSGSAYGIGNSSPTTTATEAKVSVADQTTINNGVYSPIHRSPAGPNGTVDGTGNGADEISNVTTTDGADLLYRVYYAPYQATSPVEDFDNYSIEYQIDPNLNLQEFNFRKTFFAPHSKDGYLTPLTTSPICKVSVWIDGTKRYLFTHVGDFDDDNFYDLEDYGVASTEHIEKVEFEFTNAPAGMNGSIGMRFRVKEGATGEVANTAKFNFTGYTDDPDLVGKPYIYGVGIPGTTLPATAGLAEGKRPVTIVNDAKPPVVESSITFDNHDGNTVTPGDNRITARLTNHLTSTNRLNTSHQAMLLLPRGVTLNSDPHPTYVDGEGNSSSTGGSYSIVTNNYNDTGQQLVKVNWTSADLFPSQSLEVGLDVTVASNAPAPLNMSVYGFSADTALAVPNPTSSVIETDTNDINADGNVSEPRVKTSTSYDLVRPTNVQTESLVKGSLDSSYSSLGHTTPGGDISYQLELTNTDGATIEDMTLIDVLPSVGDIGITDGASRGSEFTPTLKGPVSVSSKWQDKVDVYYSTATNPKRDDLVDSVNYPETTTPMNPAPVGATDPNWMLGTAVTDWSQIHSFKIEMKPGVKWLEGQDITLTFDMKAPTTVAPQITTAWNSFAYAANDLQVVEPQRVGIQVKAAVPFKFTKVDANDPNQVLSGAEFQLYVCDNEAVGHDHGALVTDAVVSSGECWEYTGSQTSESNGIIDFGLLDDGEYMLVESTSPAGYELPTGQWLLTIDSTQLVATDRIKIEAKGDRLPPAFMVSTENSVVQYKLPNSKQFELPKAGREGSQRIIFLGALVMGISLILLIVEKGKRNTRIF